MRLLEFVIWQAATNDGFLVRQFTLDQQRAVST
jgi:hypothetical protein